MGSRAVLSRDTSLTSEEQAFLSRARERFKENMDWLQFEDFAFGHRSPLFARDRSQQSILAHPLYQALKEMWLELGVRQGRILPSQNRNDSHGEGRKARRRG